MAWIKRHKGWLLLVALVAVLALAGVNVGSILGWFGEVWDQLTSIPVRYIVIGCAFQSGQTILNGLAWRNILQASYPEERIPVRPIVSSYAGGIAINNVLPAQAGTIAYFGMFRAIIPHSAMTTIVAGGVPQNLFYSVIAAAIYLLLFISRPGSFDVELNFLDENAWLTMVILVAAAVLIVLVLRVLWRRLHRYWIQALDGVAILRTPVRYVTRVLIVQMLAYCCRIAVNVTFMNAFGVPVTVRNVFLIIAANSISTTVAVTPGGVGTQQALASFALRGSVPASVTTAYSLGQQVIITAWNLIFGTALMATTFGWSATKDLAHSSRSYAKGGGDKDALEATAGRLVASDTPADQADEPD